jgi:hypothetical protein
LIDTAFSLVETADNSGVIRVSQVQRGYRFSRSDLTNQINTATTFLADYKPQLMIYYNTDPTGGFTPPIGLKAESYGNAVALAWVFEPPIEPDPSLFKGFRIYRDGYVVNATSIMQQSFLDTWVVAGETYNYRVTAIYLEGESIPSNEAVVTFVSDFDDTLPLVSSRLIGNFPNPFNPVTSIGFQLSVVSCPYVRMEIYNIRGQLVRTLLDGSRAFSPGVHSVIWNGRDDSGHQVSSGIYFYRMRADNYQSVRKMMLLK